MNAENKELKARERDACTLCELTAQMQDQVPELEARLERHVMRTVASREVEVVLVQGVGPWYLAPWQGFPEPHRVVRIHCRGAADGRFSLLREYRVPLESGSPRLTVLDYVE